MTLVGIVSIKIMLFNFTFKGKFAQTQELTPVHLFVYSMMMWRIIPFVKSLKGNGYAFFKGKVGYYPAARP